ncbi:MAG TPA: transcription termination/antitermination protein NusA, partial [Acidimicrobiia bacterium]
VVNELRGEKVDVVQWRDDIGQFIAEALGPAKVQEVKINEEEKTADVMVSEHQLSLAIGKEGQNARLAARLSGYKVDIHADESSSAAAEEPTAPAAPAEAVAEADASAPEDVTEVSDTAGADGASVAGDDEDAVAVDDGADDESE